MNAGNQYFLIQITMQYFPSNKPLLNSLLVKSPPHELISLLG